MTDRSRPARALRALVGALVLLAAAGCAVPVGPGAPAGRTAPRTPDPRETDLRRADQELERARIACSLIDAGELRAVGVTYPGVEGGEECSWGGTRQDGSRARLEIGVTAPDGLHFRIENAGRFDAEVVSERDGTTEVTTLRYREDCRYIARRETGEYVDLRLYEPPAPARACADARRLGAAALDELGSR